MNSIIGVCAHYQVVQNYGEGWGRAQSPCQGMHSICIVSGKIHKPYFQIIGCIVSRIKSVVTSCGLDTEGFSLRSLVLFACLLDELPEPGNTCLSCDLGIWGYGDAQVIGALTWLIGV